jgi:N-acetyl-1-D-myo-inositol-2-amino-2-deoxy-alpha-D-glucopyranoside deacetylase
MNKGVVSTARGIATAVPAALFVAAAGTALHRQAVVLSGVDVPWGVGAALLMLASVQLWLAAWSASVIPTAVAGVVAYAGVGALSSGGPSKQLLLGDAVGNIWVFGIAMVTLIMLVVASRLRMRWRSAFQVAAANAARAGAAEEELPSPR